MISALVGVSGCPPTVCAAIAIKSTARTITVIARRKVRLASFSCAMRSISAGSEIPRMFQHESRKSTAATSNAAMNPSQRLPSHKLAGTAAIASRAMNMRKRHGATMLPMLGGLFTEPLFAVGVTDQLVDLLRELRVLAQQLVDLVCEVDVLLDELVHVVADLKQRLGVHIRLL